MFYEYSDGNCPQCELARSTVPMRLNSDDYWECPECHLQASGTTFVQILGARGTGDFGTRQQSAPDSVAGAVLTGSEGQEFASREELEQYITSNVS